MLFRSYCRSSSATRRADAHSPADFQSPTATCLHFARDPASSPSRCTARWPARSLRPGSQTGGPSPFAPCAAAAASSRICSLHSISLACRNSSLRIAHPTQSAPECATLPLHRTASGSSATNHSIHKFPKAKCFQFEFCDELSLKKVGHLERLKPGFLGQTDLTLWAAELARGKAGRKSRPEVHPPLSSCNKTLRPRERRGPDGRFINLRSWLP